MTDNPEAMLPVTQEDRNAAASFGGLIEHEIRAGQHDEHALVQAFARHRTRSTTDKDARIAELEAALEPFARAGDIPAECFRDRDEPVKVSNDRLVSVEMSFSPHERAADRNGGTPAALCISLDGLTVGDFRRARQALKGRSK